MHVTFSLIDHELMTLYCWFQLHRRISLFIIRYQVSGRNWINQPQLPAILGPRVDSTVLPSFRDPGEERAPGTHALRMRLIAMFVSVRQILVTSWTRRIDFAPFCAFINSRRACAARVTVLGLCVCVSVCLLPNISLFTWLFVPQTILTFLAADEGRKF